MTPELEAHIAADLERMAPACTAMMKRFNLDAREFRAAMVPLVVMLCKHGVTRLDLDLSNLSRTKILLF